jgi:membrane associated rhomboid family serine protease
LLKESTVAGYRELQKYLVSIGAVYLMVSDLSSAQRGPVLMNAAPKSSFTSGNVWLLLPWDAESSVDTEDWMREFLQQSRLQPNLILVVSSSPMDEEEARRLRRKVGHRVAICRIDERRTVGDPQAERKLEHFFDPEYAITFHSVDLDRVIHDWSERKNADRNFYASLFEKTPNAYFTTALVVANVIVFALMAAFSKSVFTFSIEDLLRWGANYGPSVNQGEWWRLIAAAFVHVNAIHIFFNMWCLWNLGAIAERAFGNFRFLLIYFLAAIGGSAASVYFHPQIVSVGASGAVFGISGGLVGFLWKNKKRVPEGVFGILKRNMVQFIGFNILFGLATPSIDNAAHVGGLITGFLAGAVLNPNFFPAEGISLQS